HPRGTAGRTLPTGWRRRKQSRNPLIPFDRNDLRKISEESQESFLTVPADRDIPMAGSNKGYGHATAKLESRSWRNTEQGRAGRNLGLLPCRDHQSIRRAGR